MELAHSDLSLDWLSFTYNPVNFKTAPDYDASKTFYYFMDQFPEFQQMPDMIFLEHVWSHYRKCVQFNLDIMIHYDDSEYKNKGVCVQIPSRGLPLLFQLFKKDNVSDLMRELFSRGARFTRIDLAFDDFTKTFLPTDFYEFYRLGYMVTRIHHLSWYESGTKAHHGQTFYAGQRSSSKFLRIYDKEVESKGEIPAVRYEFELKKQYCTNICACIMAGEQIDFISLINEFFRLINPDSSDSNVSRKETLDEWEAFCKNLKFNEVVPVEHLVDKKRADRWRWFNETVSPSLSVEFHDDPDRVISMLLTSFYKLDPKQVRKYRNDNALSESLYDVDPFVYVSN